MGQGPGQKRVAVQSHKLLHASRLRLMPGGLEELLLPSQLLSKPPQNT